MITKLEIENWRTHKKSELEFGFGTNVIVGVMGSGKSSIVNALCYSLFGTFPALKSKQVSLNEIIMNKPNQCSEARTKIEFDFNKKKFSVERILKESGTNEAKLYEEGRLIAGPKQKDVNEKIEHMLGLSYELFSRAVYAEQNEMDFFLKLSPGDRKKKFDELLELEKYENARKNSVKLKNSIEKENLQQQNFIKQQKEIIKSHEEDKIKEKIKQEENKIIELEEKKKNVTAGTKEKKEELEKLKKEEEKYKKTKEELDTGTVRLKTLKENLENVKETDLEKIKKEKKEAEKEIILNETKEKELEKQREEFEKIINKLKEEKRIFDFQINELQKENKQIGALTGKCPTCKQELNEKHKKEINEKNNLKISQIEKEIVEMKEKISESENMLGETKKEEKEQKNKITGLKEELFKIKGKEEKAIGAEKWKKEILTLEKELPVLEKNLKEIGFDDKKIEQIRKEYFEMNSLEQIINNQIKSSIDLNKSYAENLNKVDQIKKSIQIMEKDFEKKKDACEKLGMFEKCLIVTQGDLRGAMLETTNLAMSKIWQQIYPYKDFIDARLQVVDTGYDLQVLTRNNNWVRVEGILSGGERSAAALCIRIAFALVLTKQLSMLILDEPTHNLDSSAVEKLSEMLRDNLPELVEQIFVITHDKQLENAASSKLYLLQRNKDLDEATGIETLEVV